MTKKSIPVETVKHKDKRANIPTEELRDFVAEDDKQPKKKHYPRDPSLDPQLVWKGKDEQDSQDLEVPVVPVYIQEKIHPQALIEDFRRTAKEGQPAQADLFSDFNGIQFEELIDFYHHEQNWSNRMILGDSLLVMTSLAEKEGLKGRVQMIYIDPPYGINFGSNWQVSTRKRDVKDGRAEDMTRQPEQIRAFRDTWKLGIHSYLAYLRDRLTAARELLTESGSVFVQIGDENVHLVRNVLDEVFGSENFVSQISYATTGGFETLTLSRIGDHLLWYAKEVKTIKYRQLYVEKGSVLEQERSKYDQVELPDGTRRRITRTDKDDGLSAGGRPYRLDNMFGQGAADGPTPFIYKSRPYNPPANNHWKPNYPDGLNNLALANRIQPTGDSLAYVRFLDDLSVQPINNTWTDMSGTVQSRSQGKIYAVQTSTTLLQRCILMTTDPGDLVLDPTCGSGTTAYVAEQWGRRWITCDTSRVALALARTRLMAAKFPYYLLADSIEGARKLLECGGLPPLSAESEVKTENKAGGKTENKAGASSRTPNYDIKKGFVYKRVPHVTLKSIANNPDIKQGMSREEIDAAIARHADTELLYDQPYEDSKRVRVTGPFTSESLSPYRLLPGDEERPATENEARKESRGGGTAQFATMIIENLKKAGVQNTFKNERLKFDRLEPFAGTWIHAAGEYMECGSSLPLSASSTNPGEFRSEKKGQDNAGGNSKSSRQEDKTGVSAESKAGASSRTPKVRRVAVSIGPEHGTVGREQVKEAAKEAVQGVGFDLLVVCGFAFDPHVSEESKRYGKLVVMPTRMNYDLTMGEDLLKKTGAGNLFMYFGEPDIEVNHVECGGSPPLSPGGSKRAGHEANTGSSKAKNGVPLLPHSKDLKWEVTIKGLDIYDPTTGQIRSHSTDDIACWFIDTNYNGESFFVRHAYFTGAEEPYDKLKRALRAEIDEAAWSALYSTTSRPFDPPTTGKIAIKVINHYGDEVLKVYTLAK